MRRIIFLTLFLLAATAHRSPAPIVESPEAATPAPATEQTAAPKAKTTKARKSVPKEESSAKVARAPATEHLGPARFAGSWHGKINQGLLGHTPTTLTIDATATSVELSHNLGGGTRPAVSSGNTISWRSGLAGEIAWTLVPNGDGQTAQVTMKGLLVNDTTTFQREAKR